MRRERRTGTTARGSFEVRLYAMDADNPSGIDFEGGRFESVAAARRWVRRNYPGHYRHEQYSIFKGR